MGGKVAQCLALMYPDRVAGLVVLDIAPVRYYTSGKEGWRTIAEIVQSVSSINLDGGGGGVGEDGGEMALQYKTKRDVDLALQRSTVTLQDPALRAFVLTNLESVSPSSSSSPNNSDTDVGGSDLKRSTASSSLRWKINWDGIVNDMDKIAGFDVHDIDMDNHDDNNHDDAVVATATNNEDNSNNSKPQYKGDVFFIHGGASRFVKLSHLSTISSYFPNHMLTSRPDPEASLLGIYM